MVNQSLPVSGIDVDFFTEGKISFLAELIAPLKNPLKLLDVGCGVAEAHSFIMNLDKDIEITGIDISKESLKIAKKRHKKNSYDLYNGKQIPFKDESFHIVMTSCVMHHVPPQQWQEFINEMFRVLKKGGVLAIFEHNPFNPLTRIAVNRCPFDEDAVLLRADKVEGMLKRQKDITIKTDYLFFTPFKNRLFRKMDQLLSWCPLGAQYCTYAIRK